LENVLVSDYAAEGKSLARVDGKVIFIESAVPGDVVDVQLLKSKKDWGEGRPLRFVSYSSEREKPFCSHFGVCGGCQWQMLPYEKQLVYKQKQVADNLQRIGKMLLPEMLPIAGADQTKYYRNKIEYTFGTKEFTKEKPPHPPKGGFQSLKDEGMLNGLRTSSTNIQISEGSKAPPLEGFGEAITFAKLLERVALISPLLRVRFSTSHPKDITDDVLHTMAKYENICRYIHLPLQSGSTRVLQLMNRTYTREWYMAKVDRIREIMPDCGISSDIIAGFCTEDEKDHRDTLDVMEYSRYDMSYMFFYSERPGTLAQRRYKDDIPEDIKKRRLQEIIEIQNRLSLQSNKKDLGKTFKVLIEGESKRNSENWMGRNSQNKVIVFPKGNLNRNKGEYVTVKVNDCTQATLLGEIVEM